MAYELTAYQVGALDGWALEPADARRDWMELTPEGSALRCLPLVIANQCGWVIRCPFRFSVSWNGGKSPADSLTFDFGEHREQGNTQICSFFGMGIVSFVVPWLFRTSEGIGLMVRGPTNWCKDYIAPLDAFVETDWAPYTFTMNWRILKRRTTIWFRQGEPICMLVPYPMGIIEQFKTTCAPIEANPELQEHYENWTSLRRQQFLDVARTGSAKGVYRLDYVRGSRPDGTFAGSHWSKLDLSRFPGAPAPEADAPRDPTPSHRTPPGRTA